jgi:hypothetical protein
MKTLIWILQRCIVTVGWINMALAGTIMNLFSYSIREENVLSSWATLSFHMFGVTQSITNTQYNNFMALVRERTIQTERPPLVSEAVSNVSA